MRILSLGAPLQYAKDNDCADDHVSDSYMKFFFHKSVSFIVESNCGIE